MKPGQNASQQNVPSNSSLEHNGTWHEVAGVEVLRLREKCFDISKAERTLSDILKSSW